MKQQMVPAEGVGENLTLTVRDLKELYLGTVEELRECAKECSDDDREFLLLDFEEKLLDQMAKVPLRTPEDMHALIDIWTEMKSGNDLDQCDRSDRIVLNIFRNLYAEPALKTALFTG